MAGRGEGRVERKRESSKDNFERKDGKKKNENEISTEVYSQVDQF